MKKLVSSFTLTFITVLSCALVRVDLPNINTATLTDITTQPSSIIKIYNKDKLILKKQLGPGFNKINNNGLKLIFADIVAYKLKPYGPGSITTLKAFLSSSYANCGTYPKGMYDLFQLLKPNSTIQLAFVGWNGGAVGNHAQVFATAGTGVPLLVDPTIGMAAVTTFNHIAMGRPTANNKVMTTYTHKKKDPKGFKYFNNKVITAILTGKYKPSDLLYYFPNYTTYSTAKTSQHWATPQYEKLVSKLKHPVGT